MHLRHMRDVARTCGRAGLPAACATVVSPSESVTAAAGVVQAKLFTAQQRGIESPRIKLPLVPEATT